jgi:hypothetical protein
MIAAPRTPAPGDAEAAAAFLDDVIRYRRGEIDSVRAWALVDRLSAPENGKVWSRTNVTLEVAQRLRLPGVTLDDL